MTKSEMAILVVLCEHSGELYAKDIVRLSGTKIFRGVLFVALNSLEEAGLVSSREEDEHVVLPRRLYKITEAGRRILAET